MVWESSSCSWFEPHGTRVRIVHSAKTCDTFLQDRHLELNVLGLHERLRFLHDNISNVQNERVMDVSFLFFNCCIRLIGLMFSTYFRCYNTCCLKFIPTKRSHPIWAAPDGDAFWRPTPWNLEPLFIATLQHEHPKAAVFCGGGRGGPRWAPGREKWK